MYEKRARACQGLVPGSDEWREERRCFRNEIAHARRDSKRRRIKEQIDAIAAAAGRKDIKAVHEGVRRVQGKYRGGLSKQPTKSLDGKPLWDAKELLGEWQKFLGKKFSRTPEHAERYGGWKPLRPPDMHGEPSDEDLEICLKALRKECHRRCKAGHLRARWSPRSKRRSRIRR